MPNQTLKAGVIFAIAAYAMWGFAPLYFKLLQNVPAMEILVHRIVWSALVLVLLVWGSKQLRKVKLAIRDNRVLLTLLASGLLLAANWFLFIWAVNTNRLLDASLGYYINPLLNVLLGMLFLGERLRALQKLAVALAVTGVGILLVSFGQLPWVALVLASTFGIYGLLRKTVNVDSLPGLFIETMMMLPFALVYWWYFGSSASNLLNNSLSFNLLLFCAGVVTTAPLLCFTAAARRIRYSTLGFFQYIGPSIMFLLATFVYQEPMGEARWITFGFVWLGLVLFSLDSVRQYRRTVLGEHT